MEINTNSDNGKSLGRNKKFRIRMQTGWVRDVCRCTGLLWKVMGDREWVIGTKVDVNAYNKRGGGGERWQRVRVHKGKARERGSEQKNIRHWETDGRDEMEWKMWKGTE